MVWGNDVKSGKQNDIPEQVFSEQYQARLSQWQQGFGLRAACIKLIAQKVASCQNQYFIYTTSA